MISVEEALKVILKSIPVLGLERVDILSALDRVLGEDVYAPYHIPPWDNSAMDGYAVIHQDIAGACSENPSLLKVVADLPAGYTLKKKLEKWRYTRYVPAGASLLIFLFMVYQHDFLPIRPTPFHVPSYYRAIAGDPGKIGIIELPFSKESIFFPNRPASPNMFEGTDLMNNN